MKRHETFQILRKFVIVSLPKARFKSVLACNNSTVINASRLLPGYSLIFMYLFELLNNWGSFENEALENEDRSTKHPNLENEAP